MLKAIHAQESKEAAREKAILVAEKLRVMKLAKAAKKYFRLLNGQVLILRKTIDTICKKEQNNLCPLPFQILYMP